MRILTGTINTIDGRVLQAICKVLYPKDSVLRIVGADLIYELADHCVRRSESMFLLGASPEANEKAIQYLRQRYQGLRIFGYAPPFEPYPFRQVVNREILRQLELYHPRHLIVCFGPVKQEFWIHEHASRLEQIGVAWAYGLGATIDFTAGFRRRAPSWVQKIGAEWLFRLICEPRARLRRTLEMFRMPYYALNTARRSTQLTFPSDFIKDR